MALTQEQQERLKKAREGAMPPSELSMEQRARLEATKRVKADLKKPQPGLLSKVTDFLGEAAMSPVRASVGALKFGQQYAQKVVQEVGGRVPERGESIASDVLVHGGEIGTDLLRKNQERKSNVARAGAITGDVLTSVAGAGQYGQEAGKLAGTAIKAGKVIPAMVQGFKAGVPTSAAAGFIGSVAQGREPEEVIKDVAVSTAVGAPLSSVIAGLSAGGVKAFQALKPTAEKVGEKVDDIVTRHRLSQDRKVLEKGQAHALMYGDDVKNSASGPVPMDADDLKAVRTADLAEVNPGDVGLVREANPRERKVMDEMYRIAERTMGKRAPDERYIQNAGKYVMKNIQKVDDLRSIAGEKLDDAIQAMPDKPVDVSKANEFLNKFLQKNGVKKVTGDEALRALAGDILDGSSASQNIKKGFDFSTSRFKDNAGVQKQITSLAEDLAGGQRTPSEIVNIRRRLFDLLDLADDQKDIVAPIKGALTKVRELLDEPLTQLSDDYAKAAQDYAIARGNLSDWYRKIGMKFVEGSRPSGDQIAGEKMRRLLGNAAGEYLDLFDETEDVFKHFGIKPEVDPKVLLRWSAALEDLFGTTQTQSLRGQAGAGVRDVMGPAADVITGGKSGILRAGVKAGKEALGSTPEAKREAMKLLLEQFLKSSDDLRSFGPGAARMNSPEFGGLKPVADAMQGGMAPKAAPAMESGALNNMTTGLHGAERVAQLQGVMDDYVAAGKDVPADIAREYTDAVRESLTDSSLLGPKVPPRQ